MIVLGVPGVRQNDADSDWYRNDCFVASLAGVLAYYNKLGTLTVNQMARQSALNPKDVGLTCAQGVALAAKFNLGMRVNSRTTPDQIRFEIDHRMPVIPLIWYEYITNRLARNAATGHFFIIVGYDKSTFIVNDPDYWGEYTDRGYHVPIPESEIVRAIAGVNSNGQCVFVDEAKLVTKEELDKLNTGFAPIESQVQAYRTILNGLSVTPNSTPPPTPSATPVTKYILPTYGNPRESFSTNSKDMGDIPQNTEVHVIRADVPGWWRLVDGPYAGYYLSDTILKDMK